MLRTLCQGAKQPLLGDADPPHDEYQYLHMIDTLLREGEPVHGRNGNTLALCGGAMHFSLANRTLPLLTTKRVAWRTCLRELLWFLSGSTDNGVLSNKKVRIWDANASREYLDSRGLTDNAVGDLGPIYGHQWRHFNARYTTCNADYTGRGVDQIGWLVQQLRCPVGRTSRRLVLSAWNPCQLEEMALPPCHVLAQFHVHGERLSCSLYQRSGDMGLGVPFNIASYSFLTHILAHHCGLEAHEFYYHLGNCHIYDDHVEALKEQITRVPKAFPTIRVTGTYADPADYTENDIEVVKYQHAPSVAMRMRV